MFLLVLQRILNTAEHVTMSPICKMLQQVEVEFVVSCWNDVISRHFIQATNMFLCRALFKK